MTSNMRLAFFDNLRVFLISAVIIHHAGQAYGPTGSWWPVQEQVRAEILGPFFMVNRSFGMSLFFMIAGYFAALSCHQHGPQALAKNRLKRLGMPLLVFSLLMIPLQVFVFGPLVTGELGDPWPIDVGHLWFVQHLLLFTVGYALWCMFRNQREKPSPKPLDPPGYGKVVAFAFGLALVLSIIRNWFYIDEWVYIFGYVRVAFADLPRDLSMFMVGILAYRRQWVTCFSSRVGRVWLLIGLSLAGIWYVYDLWLMERITINDMLWGVILPFWETLLCCAMCIGLTVLFRDRFNRQGPLLTEMAKSTYGAYIIHVFIVFFVQYLLLGFAAPPLSKFLLVSLITVCASFLLAGLIRRPLRI